MASGVMLLAAALLLSSPPVHPLVHGEGVLTAERGTMAAGESLKLTGASFEPGEEYQIKLVGALQEFTLGTVRVSPDSTFALTVAIPAEAREGSYRLEVVAPDGDVSAGLDVTLLAASPIPSASSTDPMAGMDHPPGAMMARADEVPIDRSYTGGVLAVIVGLIGLAAGVGIGLLSRRGLEPV